jgi:hypothetical protein
MTHRINRTAATTLSGNFVELRNHVLLFVYYLFKLLVLQLQEVSLLGDLIYDCLVLSQLDGICLLLRLLRLQDFTLDIALALHLAYLISLFG